MNMKITAKDFFLHIAAVDLLYTGTVALLNVLFRVINVAFPQVAEYSYYSPSISLPVATLIVVFPLFLFISNIIRKSYVLEPGMLDYPVRKWLIYITLFIAGAVLAGDLVVLLYFFLDGRELSPAFLLKVLSVILVAGGIFGYYIDDLKGRVVGSRQNLWRAFGAFLVIGSIVLGFSVLGTPAKQRMIRYDSQKVSDLQNIQWQLVNYWQQKGTLPETLAELEDPISGFTIPLDPQTRTPYEYERVAPLVFNLCAEFNKTSQMIGGSISRNLYPEPIGRIGESWQHEAGRQCFERTIDPELYPVRTK
jgi:hypothetical protein